MSGLAEVFVSNSPTDMLPDQRIGSYQQWCRRIIAVERLGPAIIAPLIRLLFFAVNKVGLGHAVRLSILQKQLQRKRKVSCHFLTDSDHVSGLSCTGSEVQIPGNASMTERGRLIDRGFNAALERVQPDTVICATYWPQYGIEYLRDTGVRTILLMRLMNAMIMPGRVRTAVEAFDTVLIPHHPSEISWTFHRSPGAVRYLSSQAIGFVGPIARRARTPPSTTPVIFTVGGGGEWPGAGHKNRIPTYLDTFFEAAGRLIRRGHPKPTLAVGPLFDVDRKFSEAFTLLRTKQARPGGFASPASPRHGCRGL